MQELEREGHKFKAREAAVLRAIPFAPQPVKRFGKSLILHLINSLKSSRFSSREAVANTQGPDLCTDRRAMEREKFEVSARSHRLNWINYQP